MDLETELRAKLNDLVGQMTAIVESEERSDAATANLRALETAAGEVRARLEDLARVAELRQAGDELTGRIGRAAARTAEREPAAVSESLGERFVRSDAFTSYPGLGSSSRIGFDVPELLQRALPLTNTTWAGAFTKPAPRDISQPTAATPLLDLIPAIPWDDEIVPFVKWAKAAGGATVVAENASKPSVEFLPTSTQEAMETIAVWTEATRQLLKRPDAVKAKIDAQLVADIMRQAEAEAAAAIAAATVPTATGATLLASIRKGVATLQKSGLAANAVLLNPDDWADLDIDVFNSTLNGPTIGQRFWSLTPIPVGSQAAGTAMVGDFNVACERFVNRRVEVFLTDSHASNFTKNVITILAESRELTSVVRPYALVKCSKTVVAASDEVSE